MIDFKKYADYIYCLNYLPNGRTKIMADRFNNIGIDINDSNFFYFNNDVEHIICKTEENMVMNRSMFHYGFEIPTYPDQADSNTKYAITVGYNTYRVLKMAQYMGYERIMIFEDDIVFHKDHEFIKSNLDIINSTNFDYCMCQTTFWNGWNENVQDASDKEQLLNNGCTAITDNLFRINPWTSVGLYCGAWIILTKYGIEKIINYFEENNIFLCIDMFAHKNEYLNFDIIFTPKPLGIQLEYCKFNKNIIIDEYI